MKMLKEKDPIIVSWAVELPYIERGLTHMAGGWLITPALYRRVNAAQMGESLRGRVTDPRSGKKQIAEIVIGPRYY